MIIKLPTLKKEYVEETKSINKLKGEITFKVDTSLYADIRYEQYFKEEEGEKSLSAFAQRVFRDASSRGVASVEENLADVLKVLYCYLENDNVPTFKDFARLFDYEIAAEILEKLGDVLEVAFSSATKN